MASILTIIIIVAVLLLIFCTIPVKNEMRGNEIVTHYALGNTTSIDISDAVFSPVPEEAQKDIIRVGGTSIGRFKSGNFKNIKTGDKYHLYLTGKGTRVDFEADGKKYLVDLPQEHR